MADKDGGVPIHLKVACMRYMYTLPCFSVSCTKRNNTLWSLVCFFVWHSLSEMGSIGAYSFLQERRSPGSSVGLELAYWSSGPSSIPAWRKIFSTVNGAPLHTAFHYRPLIVLIWLKHCWKGHKIASHPSIHSSREDLINPFLLGNP